MFNFIYEWNVIAVIEKPNMKSVYESRYYYAISVITHPVKIIYKMVSTWSNVSQLGLPFRV